MGRRVGYRYGTELGNGGNRMTGSDRAAASARNDALRADVDELLATLERQRRDLAEAQTRLASMTVTAWSSDNLVRVESNAAGVPVRVHLEPEAFKRSTPEKLGRSITEAVQAAARRATEAAEQAYAPVEEVAGDVPDLPDLVPGAPSIRALVDSLFPDPTPPPPASMNPEEEDSYYRERRYLEGDR